MRSAPDVLFAGVPAEQVDEARDFYASRAAGRGPSTPEELKEARARRAVPRTADSPAVEISPLYGALHGLPPTLLIVGSTDVLLEDDLTLAGRLSAAGDDVEVRVYPEAPHGFTGHPTAMARTALSGVDSWLRDRLAQS